MHHALICTSTLARNSIDSSVSFGRQLLHIAEPTQICPPSHDTLYRILLLATDNPLALS